MLTKFNARMAAKEILGKWQNLRGDAVEKYLDEKFEGAWHQFDTFHQEYLDVRSAYYWMRHLAGEEYFSA